VGYQITQALNPINGEGSFSFWNSSYTQLHTVRIQQAHLENDTAKTIHMDGKAYLDFNRCGTPLVEIVTRPDFHSADEVTDFLKELQRVVKWNNIAYADLEKGQMRVDVNLSVSDTDQLGTRVEIKNMNSFSAIRRAIEHEYNRHVAVIQA
jgi:aspartyl-tRNA(Asn)/glutamyl-tRNA(Gln) amidotransferase subunit B